MIYPKIPVLLYHSINVQKNKNQIDIIEFEKQISYLNKKKYNSTFIKNIKPDLKKQFIITFDDGYKEVARYLLPILKKYNFKAICFVVSNHIGKTNIWDKNQKNFNAKELMNKDDINEWLKNGMLIGSHSHNHYDLTKLDYKELKNEIIYSKDYLEQKFSTQILDFCYPFGKINNNVYMETKKIYNNAYTTNRSRYLFNRHDPLLVPRVDMGKKLSSLKIFFKLRTIYEDVKFIKNEI